MADVALSAPHDTRQLPANDEPALAAIMQDIAKCGYKLLPLGSGEDGKRPLINFVGSKGAPMTLCLKKMSETGSRMYGIRLDGLVVVDIDTDTPEAHEYVRKEFGLSPVVTRTARGVHYWYRSVGFVPRRVRLTGVVIDFKSGDSQYVVGPGSMRPDGTVYRSIGEPLGWKSNLPILRYKPSLQVVSTSGKIRDGVRDDFLWRRGLELASTSECEDEVFEELRAFRDLECENPETVSDAEVRAKARWAWRNRERHTLWRGRNSRAFYCRAASDLLEDYLPASAEKNPPSPSARAYAWKVYTWVTAFHGHRSGSFTLNAPGLIRNRHLKNMTKTQVYDAIALLVSAGLLRRVREPKFGSQKVAALYEIVPDSQLVSLSILQGRVCKGYFIPKYGNAQGRGV